MDPPSSPLPQYIPRIFMDHSVWKDNMYKSRNSGAANFATKLYLSICETQPFLWAEVYWKQQKQVAGNASCKKSLAVFSVIDTARAGLRSCMAQCKTFFSWPLPHGPPSHQVEWQGQAQGGWNPEVGGGDVICWPPTASREADFRPKGRQTFQWWESTHCARLVTPQHGGFWAGAPSKAGVSQLFNMKSTSGILHILQTVPLAGRMCLGQPNVTSINVGAPTSTPA